MYLLRTCAKQCDVITAIWFYHVCVIFRCCIIVIYCIMSYDIDSSVVMLLRIGSSSNSICSLIIELIRAVTWFVVTYPLHSFYFINLFIYRLYYADLFSYLAIIVQTNNLLVCWLYSYQDCVNCVTRATRP